MVRVGANMLCLSPLQRQLVASGKRWPGAQLLLTGASDADLSYTVSHARSNRTPPQLVVANVVSDRPKEASDQAMTEAIRGVLPRTTPELRATLRSAISRDRRLGWTLRLIRDDRHIENLLGTILADDAVCVDVGANNGAFLELFCAAAPFGQHVAVEPIPALANTLRTKFPCVTVIEAVLSQAPAQEIEFTIVDDKPAWSGLVLQEFVAELATTRITVPSTTLDELVADTQSVDLVKVDVEGAEELVLRGGVETLASKRPIVLFEHAAIHADNYGHTPEDLYRLLADLEYRIERVDRMKSYNSEAKFVDVVRRASVLGYNRRAETNFWAVPKEGRSLSTESTLG